MAKPEDDESDGELTLDREDRTVPQHASLRAPSHPRSIDEPATERRREALR